MPAVVIDADAAEILAANASGSEAFGLFPYASFPIALDPTLPALVRLRELAATNDAASEGPEVLDFSSKGRPRPINCLMTRQGKGGSQAFLLRVVSAELRPRNAEPLAAPAPPPPEPPPSASVDENLDRPGTAKEPTSEPTRTDADTLKEIARQIREAGLSPRPPHDDAAGLEPPPPVNAGVEPEPTPKSSEVSEQPPADSARKMVSVLDPDHLAKLAHELKTPLTAIAAAAEVMRDERLGEMGNERYLSYAADIHESATHALDVITTLLSEGGKPSAPVSRLIALDLNAIVARTVSSMQALARSRGLTLAFDAEASRPHVIANPTAIRQILLNLLTNAIKFTPRDGDVRVVTGYLDDGRVFLVVRDTGCGMGDNKTGARAMAASDEASPPWTHGHGIGLPLVQRLVREMGADIEIDSEPGKGTVVLIVFGGFARWSA